MHLSVEQTTNSIAEGECGGLSRQSNHGLLWEGQIGAASYDTGMSGKVNDRPVNI